MSNLDSILLKQYYMIMNVYIDYSSAALPRVGPSCYTCHLLVIVFIAVVPSSVSKPKPLDPDSAVVSQVYVLLT